MYDVIKLYLRAFFFVFISLLPSSTFAWKEAIIWYFGHGAGLEFNYGPPRVWLEGPLNSHEGSAVMSREGEQAFILQTDAGSGTGSRRKWILAGNLAEIHGFSASGRELGVGE